MRPTTSMLIIISLAQTALSGSLQVIDYDGQCVMWSNDNHGCTGYSAPFAQLNGSYCSELSEVVNGTRQDFSVLNVNACGTENGGAAAWIRINKNGLVKFFNQGGNHSECMLNNEFEVGSWCTAADL